MKKIRRLRYVAWLSAFVLSAIGAVATQSAGVSSALDVKAAAFSAASPFRPPAAPNCGATIYKSNGTPWKCTFADEFSGTSLDSTKWVAQTTASNGFHYGPDCTVNSPNNISVSGGTVKLTVRKEAAPFTCKNPYGDYQTQYTAGGIMTWGKFSQAYGRFEFRAKMPDATTAGVHSALWMYPIKDTYGGWPKSGEIDVLEYYSQYPDRSVPYIHYLIPEMLDQPNFSGTSEWGCTMVDPKTFHTYVADWTTTGIKITFDGQTCMNHTWNTASPLTGSQPFDKPFAIIMSQVMGIATNEVTSSTTLPATMQIDWVHVWS